MSTDTTKRKDQLIAVTGGTGTVGSEMLRLLSVGGANVRAFSRQPEKGAKLPGVEWVAGDLADKKSMASGLAGVDSLFLLTGNIPNMVYAQNNGIKAAAEAGVRRVVKLSALGASEHSNSVIGLWHYNVERTLEQSGLAWTLLRPHAYMQNFIGQAEDIRQGRIYSAAGDGRVPFLDTRDLSAVAAKILLDGGWEGKKLVLTGPDGRSFDEVAEVFSKLLGRKVEHVREDEDATWDANAQGRDPGLAGRRATCLVHLLARGRHHGQDHGNRGTGDRPCTSELGGFCQRPQAPLHTLNHGRSG
jgi:uncharacterized protein YbjT (DUF2867 family)